MLPAQQRRGRDLLLVALLVVGGLALGWGVLSTAMADRLAKSNPEAALAWRADHAGALLAQAERSLARGDLDGAERLARLSLSQDALEIPATRVLGLVADRRGQDAAAVRLMKSAGARSNRDPAVQTWLFARLAAEGDYAGALDRADALLRDEPDLARSFYPALADLARKPEAIPALAARLATNPPWRSGFIQSWIRETGDIDGPIALVNRMDAIGAHFTEEERIRLVNRLIRERRFQQAFVLWATGLSVSDMAALADINDAGFEGRPVGGPFTWQMERAAQSVADYEVAPQGKGRALHLFFYGAPAPKLVVRQLLILPPGRRILTGEVRADGFESVEGLVWSLRCADGNKKVIGETAPVLTSIGWTRFSAAFEIPDEGCEAQWLSLGVPGRTLGLRDMRGDVWFDNLAFRR